MGNTFSIIFHLVAMILLIIEAKDMDLIHLALMAECMAVYFKVWDD